MAVIELFWMTLIIVAVRLLLMRLELNILRLDHVIAILLRKSLKDWCECLWLWHHLSPCLLCGESMSRFWVWVGIIVIYKWSSDTNCTLSWDQLCITLIIEIVNLLIGVDFLIIDLFNELQLDVVTHLRALWGVVVSEVVATWSLSFY